MENEKKIVQYKLKKCLCCGKDSDITDKDELFCQGCGKPLINKCSEYDCSEILSQDAAFCKYCGGRSIFLNLNLVKSTVTSEPDFYIPDDDLPF